MSGIQKRAEQFDKAVSWVERVHNVLKYLGVAGRIDGALGVAFTVIWVWLVKAVGHMPFWVSVPAGLLVGILLLQFIAAVGRVLALRGIRTLDIQQLGRDCIQLQDDVFEWFVSRQDIAPDRPIHPLPDAGEEAKRNFMYDEWQRGVRRSNQTRAKFAEKFAHRIVATCHLLQRTEIPAPSLWGLDHNPGPIVAYIGAVGVLLERGLLEDARKMDPKVVREMHMYFD